MVLLTESDLAYLRAELGTAIDEDAMQERYDRLGTVTAVAAEVIRERLATLLSNPTSFTLPGVYSESTNDAVIKALQEQATRLQTAASGPAAGSGRLVRPDRVR